MLKDPVALKEYRRQYYLKNMERIKERSRQQRIRLNKPKRTRLPPEEKKRRDDYHKAQYRKANSDYYLFKTRERQAKQKNRQPKWLTKLQLDQIKCIYKKCKYYRKIGMDFHVDHIVPLQGKNVSGLHVPWNLQIIPAKDNIKKGNRYE